MLAADVLHLHHILLGHDGVVLTAPEGKDGEASEVSVEDAGEVSGATSVVVTTYFQTVSSVSCKLLDCKLEIKERDFSEKGTNFHLL